MRSSHSTTRYAAILLVAALACAGAQAQGATNLYVATNGNNAWSGALPAPNADGSDGPFATIHGARDAIRQLKVGGATGPVVVSIRGGDYRIAEPIVFGPEDSGTADAPIVYKAFEDEDPVIHGGRPITGWKQEGAFWTADVPEVRDGTWTFSALWVNGERRTPARTPNATNLAGDYPTDDDLFFMDGPVMVKNADTGKEDRSGTRMRYREGDLQSWASLEDSVFVVFHSWETALLRPKAINEAERTVDFTGGTNWGFCRWRPDQWYFIEHLFEGLDQPGEWYLDRKAGTIYYIPMPGETLNTIEAVAPVVKQLVLIQGNPAEKQFVEHLAFEGLAFHYSEYTIEPQGHSDGQAAHSVPAAFEARGARHCRIERCEVGHVGTYGVWFREGCQDNVLRRSEVFDLGAGGVRIGEGGTPPTEDQAAERNVIDNCFIHDGGRIFRGGVGVWIGRSSYNTVSHCEICDIRYSGISVGWSWGYAESTAHHNIIEYNLVHHTAKGQLSDTGGIYMLGASPGTVVRNNVFHDVMSNPRVSGGWGIYFDEGSTGILAENNLVYNTRTGTLHQHYGKENMVRNNIFAFSHGPQLIRSRDEDHISFFFENNIVYFNNNSLLGSRWGNGNFRLDNNCYWDTSGDEIEFNGLSLSEWRARGQDANSIIADPLFHNAEAADFRLRPDSPAIEHGFKPFDYTEAGLCGDPEWVEKPRQIPRAPFSPPPLPKPKSYADDFEQTPVGGTAANASTLGEEGDARIRVTDETAASGKRSLKITDAPGLKQAFNPHLVYAPHLSKGHATGTFAIRLEPGAILYHEWRDNRNPYRVGPSLWFQANGDLMARGAKLLTVPHSQWVTVEIGCDLGRDADGTYDLTVTIPGQDPQQFENLPCGAGDFSRLDWCGFVSNATESVVAYIDDVRIVTE
ncbi:MAG: right-handed parallel beta-helix repeat-containing protein [bacterium]|nr:right-handed parallel beta-helix repeat-containing protein [bacterium]